MNQSATSPEIAAAPYVTLDGNEAVASVAYRLVETVAIYPITPSSPMAEWCDQWSTAGRQNLYGTVPKVVEMQSEAGAAGALHGMLQVGSLSTTFTASQGLLLMIPNMYKIAGELLPFCMHVTARTLATHALSIFGDHSDVMACRQTGFAMLSSGSVQEAQDLACVAHAATLESRIPFLHFFDGFRTSHEVGKIHALSDAQLREMMSGDEQSIAAFRHHGLSPDRPCVRGTAQNPDVFFQAREACNSFYDRAPALVQAAMDRFAGITGRSYHLFDYSGDPQAERVVVIMGSGGETAQQASQWLNERGEKTGVLRVRLYRPFAVEAFIAALPPTVRRIAALDRTKEPGAVGEPLYVDVVAALREACDRGLASFDAEPLVVGGRYGLSSKEFTPAMVKSIFDELKAPAPKNHFTIGIVDDVTHTSLAFDPEFDIEPKEVVRAVFFGLGADGTVGANKNTIKIIGEETALHAQGYFVYDSKKSGAVTISHLRFGPKPIQAPFLIKRANFIGCHQWSFLDRYDVLGYAAEGATLLLNSPFGPQETWQRLSVETQREILDKKLKCYVIDAYTVAKATGMGGRINTIMQTCFFAISNVMPREEAIAQIKKAIRKTYARKGEAVVERNCRAVDQTLAALHAAEIPNTVSGDIHRTATVSAAAPEFVQRVSAVMMANKGDLLPVSAFPADGTWPTGTTRWEKRAIALEIPAWDPAICIQCNKCVLVCPHAAIRAKFYPASQLAETPPTFKSTAFRSQEWKDSQYSLQVAPEDCTGCTLCVAVCPVKSKTDPKQKAINMQPMPPLRAQERVNYDFFLKLPSPDRASLPLDVKGTQFRETLFEYSSACSGCGETPYVKLLTQMVGDRLIVANATGCSSIYGGNLPTTPYAVNAEHRGPAWSNSLFEDNAEYGFGQRVALDKQTEIARELTRQLAPRIGGELAEGLLNSAQNNEREIGQQRERVSELRRRLQQYALPAASSLHVLADALVKKSVWIVGGDGWAYDIGFGGLDHVLALNAKVNILVLDTEAYSNTGGQQSKATPMGAVARFAVSGKRVAKKDLAQIAMTYGTAYVAQIALGAKDSQTVKAFEEAEAHPGASLIIAYSPCIEHGYTLGLGLEQQKLAVESGFWPLFRFDPRRVAEGLPGLKLDSGAPKIPLEKFCATERRFQTLAQQDPAVYKAMLDSAQEDVLRKFAHLQRMSTAPAPSLTLPPASHS
ncbi:MAG TPA: pyruvate:ferredoxin (flavodoxin) oxidoreductase [Verrucomicrobiae bacterium]|jgi:pyruvate-ferredoxin/flavodoxin oxidoreductase|nr:pyruvate:ferredoxin (flavodoxin) oxidoreductase [Verrucomicrobiae bacterium]